MNLTILLKKTRSNVRIGKLLLNYFTKDSYQFKFDLKSGYFHYNICYNQQTYLGFKRRNNFYCFTVLAFGLSSAPYLFTKCLRPLVKHWRENGIDIVLYLDDGFGISKDKMSSKHNSSFVKKSLENAGLLINTEKSVFEPVQKLEWLGLVWNSDDFSITDRRINDTTLKSLDNILKIFPFFTAR